MAGSATGSGSRRCWCLSSGLATFSRWSALPGPGRLRRPAWYPWNSSRSVSAVLADEEYAQFKYRNPSQTHLVGVRAVVGEVVRRALDARRLARSARFRMTVLHTVSLLGFGAFERRALASAFAMSASREVGYRLSDRMEDSRFLVVDTDGLDALDAVRAVRRDHRLQDAVFVGLQAPAEARAWLMRPLDAARVLKELDLLAARGTGPVSRTDGPTDMAGPSGWLQPQPAGRPAGASTENPLLSAVRGRRLGDRLASAARPGQPDRRS